MAPYIKLSTDSWEEENTFETYDTFELPPIIIDLNNTLNTYV